RRTPGSAGKSACARVVITQRGHGPVTCSRTSPSSRSRPTQVCSTKPRAPGPQSTTRLGRKRRTSNRPCGYAPRSWSTAAVVSRGQVEEGGGGHRLVGDRVPVIQPLQVGPVFLQNRRGRGRPVQGNRPAQGGGKHPVAFPLFAPDGGPVGERDPQRGERGVAP